MLCAALGITACGHADDQARIRASRAAPVKRYDTTQALASNGAMVVAGTQSGAVLTSRDGGASWLRIELAANASIIDMAVCPDGSFVALDFNRRVWTAAADARDWRAQPLAQPRTPLAITCAPDASWWVVGTNATIAGSSDGGATWRASDLGIDAQLTAVHFFDATKGIALGEFGLQLSTADGGATWVKQAPIPNDFYPYSMLFESPQRGWVSGLTGQVLQTTDGGATWLAQDNTTGLALYRLFMAGGVPHGAGAAGTVVRLAGDKWEAVPDVHVRPAFLAGATGLAKRAGLVVGGPGGLLSSVRTAASAASATTR